MINPNCFRPFGNRVLVQRKPLPEQSMGGVFVLGRDYPTIGKVLKWGVTPVDGFPFFTHWTDAEVQWSIDSNFDHKLVGPDLLLLDYTDLNLIIFHRAHALGDRLLVERIPDIGGYLEHKTDLFVKEAYRTHHALGTVASSGPGTLSRKNKFLPNNASIGDTIVFNLFKASEITLSNKDYLIIRNEDAIATMERD